MALKPCWGCDPRFCQCLEKEVKCLVEFRRHVFQDKPWDPIRPCGLVIWGAAECLLHNGGCVVSCDHRDR